MDGKMGVMKYSTLWWPLLTAFWFFLWQDSVFAGVFMFNLLFNVTLLAEEFKNPDKTHSP